MGKASVCNTILSGSYFCLHLVKQRMLGREERANRLLCDKFTGLPEKLRELRICNAHDYGLLHQNNAD